MTKRLKILLVEDNKIDQVAFERFVERKNLPYGYVIASSVAEAKTSLATERFDALVIDYLLGDGTAFDLFDEMGDVPVVVITSNGNEEIAVKAMKAGATDYLIKDLEGHYLTILPVTIESAIRFRQTQDELRRHRQHLEELVEERTVELIRANEQLVTEIAERVRAEESLQKAHDELEMRVEERTTEFVNANKLLRVEIEDRKWAETALRESEERYRAIFEQAVDSIILFDIENITPMEFNDKTYENLGYTREEFQHIKLSDIEVIESAEEIAKHIEQLVKEGRIFFETRHKTKDGEIRDILVSSKIISLQGKDFALSVWRDITERVRVEDALRESQSNLSALIENTDGSIWSVDRDYRLIVGNSVFHRNVSTGRGCPFSSGDNVLADDFAAVVLDEWRGYYDRALRGERFSVEARRRVVDTQSSFEYRFNPIRTADRAVAGVTVYGRDITERKRAEEKIQQQNEFLNNIIESLTHPFYVIDATDYHIVTANSDTWALGDASMKTCYALTHKRSNPCTGVEHPCPLQEIKQTKKPLVVEHFHFDKDNNPMNVELHGFPILNSAGEVVQMIEYTLDITKRKRAEEALQARTRELALINSAGWAFVSSLELDQVLATVLDQVRQIIKIMACSIWLVDPKSDDLVCRAAASPGDDIVRGWRLAPGQGLGGWVVQYGESLNVLDVQTDPRHFKEVDRQTGLKLRSILGVPLRTQNRISGVLQLVDEVENRFSPDDVHLAESLAALAAIAIENARLYKQTQQDATAKTLLLQEVNHRVKNNLAAITGILYIEQRHAQQSGDRHTYGSIVDDLVNRIKGLATVHQLLSASNWTPLPLVKLAQQVINSALQALPPDRQILTDVSATAPVTVTPKAAHNLAIVINELSTNVIKYAVSLQETTQITVSITPKPDEGIIMLEFRDNGPGFSAAVLQSEGRNVGLYLIENTVHHSLNGEITLYNEHGAVVVIQFVKDWE